MIRSEESLFNALGRRQGHRISLNTLRGGLGFDVVWAVCCVLVDTLEILYAVMYE